MMIVGSQIQALLLLPEFPVRVENVARLQEECDEGLYVIPKEA